MTNLSDIVDVDYLNTISDHDREFEGELLQVFISDSSQHLVAAKKALQGKDFLQLSREAHHLKGSSSNIGISAMQKLALELEQCAITQQDQPMARLLEQLETNLQAVETFFLTNYSIS